MKMLNAIVFYRIAHWLYKNHIPLLPKLFQLIIFLCYNCSVPCRIKIGKGTRFSHGGIGVLINNSVEIGENCVIGTNCSIVGQTPYNHTPKIKDNVFIANGAVIQGPVIVGNNVIVGANAVVTSSVPDYAIVAGIPAKIIGDTRELGYEIGKSHATDSTIKKELSWDDYKNNQ